MHTGAGFLILGVGLLLVPSRSILADILVGQRKGSWVARRALPAVFILPGLEGWLFLHPALSLGRPVFGMALFAVTVTAGGAMTLIFIASFMNREERMAAEVAAMQDHSAILISQSEHELRLITDHLPTLLSYMDPCGIFVRVNHTYESWTGRPARAIVATVSANCLATSIGKTPAPPVRPPSPAQPSPSRSATLLSKAPDRLRSPMRPISMRPAWFAALACLVLDMQARHQTEAALRQSEKLAVVGRLASSIAHEINNPLEAVTNLLYLAEPDTRGLPGAEYVQQAQEQLLRVTHIVTQTLRFHRQAAGPVSCTLSEIIEQVLVLHHGRLSQAEIQVESRYRDPGAIHCRDGEIRQALANLIGNASDAMSAGGRLLLRTRPACPSLTGRAGVIVTIADTGHGIPRAARDTLFQPFHTTKGDRGFGLGLWITKEIIERHHGTLQVISHAGRKPTGTVFRLFVADLTV